MEINSILKDVVAYVEVRSNNDNRSAAVSQKLLQLGATVQPTFSDDVTHVVFKEGLKRTWIKAQKRNIPVVSVSWLNSCLENRMRMSEKEFPALLPEIKDSPLPCFKPAPRWKKMKSMQPCDFDEELARSAERGEKRRKRELMANRFKLAEDSTPTLSLNPPILALETQARSPHVSSLLNITSPIPDTPPSLKDRYEKMVREQKLVLSSDDVESPLITPKTFKEKPLQRRLFEKFASMSSSSMESSDDDMSGIVSGLLKRLDSRNNSPSCVDQNISSPKLTPNLTHGARANISSTNTNSNLIQGTKPHHSSPKLNPNLIQGVSAEDDDTADSIWQCKFCTSPEGFVLSPSRKGEEQRSHSPVAGCKADERWGTESPRPVLSPQGFNIETPEINKSLKGLNLSLKKKNSLSVAKHHDGASTNHNENDENLKESVRDETVPKDASVSKIKPQEIVRERRQSRRVSVVRKLDNSDSKATSSLPLKSNEINCPTASPPPQPDFKPKVTKKRNLLSAKQLADALLAPKETDNDKAQKTTEIDASKNTSGKPQGNVKKHRKSAKADADFLFGLTETKSAATKVQERRRSQRLSSVQPATPTKHCDGPTELPATTAAEKANSKTRKLSHPHTTSVSCDQSATPTKHSDPAETSTSTTAEKNNAKTRKFSRPHTTSVSCDQSATLNDLSKNDTLGTSMSVMYDNETSVRGKRKSVSSRRSIDDFSLSKTDKFKHQHKPVLKGITEQDLVTENTSTTSKTKPTHSKAYLKRNRSTSSSDACRESKPSFKKSKGKQSTSSEDGNNSQLSDSHMSDEAPASLRHARSLVMEQSMITGLKSQYSLVLTSLHRGEQELVYSVVKKLGAFQMTNNVDATTTHVVCGDARRTLNVIHCVARGCWLLRKEWVLESLEAREWLLEENYEMEQEFPAAKISRCERQAIGAGYKLGIFTKTGPVYVSKDSTPARQELVQLIRLCGGQVTGSKSRAFVFVGDKHSPDRVVIRPTWILDSIMKLKLLDMTDYIVTPPPSSLRETSPEF
ncbi:microcephalin-like [Physella acuta]|uniref:microcephalin-like n=1 Tax=Physella acuta TaxID=109671 RepID=UPI0027DBB6E6|nr:microcephalin-like [Physella acuta]